MHAQFKKNMIFENLYKLLFVLQINNLLKEIWVKCA